MEFIKGNYGFVKPRSAYWLGDGSGIQNVGQLMVGQFCPKQEVPKLGGDNVYEDSMVCVKSNIQQIQSTKKKPKRRGRPRNNIIQHSSHLVSEGLPLNLVHFPPFRRARKSQPANGYNRFGLKRKSKENISLRDQSVNSSRYKPYPSFLSDSSKSYPQTVSETNHQHWSISDLRATNNLFRQNVSPYNLQPQTVHPFIKPSDVTAPPKPKLRQNEISDCPDDLQEPMLKPHKLRELVNWLLTRMSYNMNSLPPMVYDIHLSLSDMGLYEDVGMKQLFHWLWQAELQPVTRAPSTATSPKVVVVAQPSSQVFDGWSSMAQ